MTHSSTEARGDSKSEDVMETAHSENNPEAGDLTDNGTWSEVLFHTHGIPLTSKSLEGLEPEKQLNDELINAMLQMINFDNDRNAFCVSTFFFPKFTESTNEGKVKCVKGFFKEISKKTKVDMILIPFHHENHWTLGNFDIAENRVEYYDHLFLTDDSKCSVFQPVSILQQVARIMDDLQSVFPNVHKFESESPAVFVATDADIGRQHNSYDCGVFVCIDANCLSRRCRPSTSVDEIPGFRSRMFKSLMKNDLKFLHETATAGRYSQNTEDDLDELWSSQSETEETFKSTCDAKTSPVGVIPNTGNTCHFTAACITLCQHLHSPTGQPLQTASFGSDIPASVQELIDILKFLSGRSDKVAIASINRVLSSLYDASAAKLPQDVGETFQKIWELLRRPFTGPKLVKNYTCDIHSFQSRRTEPEEFHVFSLVLPVVTELNIGISLEVLVEQQTAEPQKWRCSEECKGEAGTVVQLITSPPPTVLTFAINRNTGTSNKNTTPVNIPEIVRVQFQCESNNESELLVHNYEPISVVLHSNKAEHLHADYDGEFSAEVPLSETGKGAHYVTVTINRADDVDIYYLHDDLKYPEIQIISQEYIKMRGGLIAMITTRLCDHHSKFDDIDSEGTEGHQDIQNAENHLRTDSDVSISTQRTTNEFKHWLEVNYQPMTYKISWHTQVLFRQLRCFLINSYADTIRIPGFEEAYHTTIRTLDEAPAQVISMFGVQAIQYMWELKNLFVFELSLSQTDNETSDLVFFKLSVDTSPKSSPFSWDLTTRSLLQTCVCQSHVNSICGQEKSKCEFVYNQLFPVAMIEEVVFQTVITEPSWSERYKKGVYRTGNEEVFFWIGPTVDTCCSNFLGVLVTQEEIYASLYPEEGKKLWQEESGIMQTINCTYPKSMVPKSYDGLRNRWNLVESESSKLTRATTTTSVIETNVGTYWKVSQALLSVIELTFDQSHAYLTNGRRGALLQSLALGDRVCVGFEKSQSVFEEGVRLIGDLVVKDSTYKPQVHLLHRNYGDVVSFEGFRGANLYIGNDSATLQPEYVALIKKLASTKSLIYFWCAKLSITVFEGIVDEKTQKQWYMKSLTKLKQESNSHSFFIWIKKAIYWPENPSLSVRSKAKTLSSDEVGQWINKARAGIVTEASGTKMATPTFSTASSNKIADTHTSSFLSPEPSRKQSLRIASKLSAECSASLETRKLFYSPSVTTKLDGKVPNSDTPESAKLKKSLASASQKVAELTEQVNKLKQRNGKLVEPSNKKKDGKRNKKISELETKLAETQDELQAAENEVTEQEGTIALLREEKEKLVNVPKSSNTPKVNTDSSGKEILVKIDTLVKSVQKMNPSSSADAIMEVLANLSKEVKSSKKSLLPTVVMDQTPILEKLDNLEAEIKKNASTPAPSFNQKDMLDKLDSFEQQLKRLPDVGKLLTSKLDKHNEDLLQSKILQKLNEQGDDLRKELKNGLDKVVSEKKIEALEEKNVFYSNVLKVLTIPTVGSKHDDQTTKHRRERSESSTRSRKRSRSYHTNRRKRSRSYSHRSRSRIRSRSRERKFSSERHLKSKRRLKSPSRCSSRTSTRSDSSRWSSRSSSRIEMRQSPPICLSWDVSAVGDFLSKNRFPQEVVEAFAESKVHGLILPSLSWASLEEIRVQNDREKFNANQKEALYRLIRGLVDPNRK